MGRPSWTTRLTVEHCLAFDASWLRRGGAFKRSQIQTGAFQWSGSFGSIMAALGYWVGRSKSEGWVVLIDPELAARYPAAVRVPECIIRLTPTRPNLGGLRFWFRCPIRRNGKECGRRVRKLYLPPGAKIFGCRCCYNLTYRSAQTHDPRPYKLAMSLDAIDAALNSGDVRQGLLAARALLLQRKWARDGRWARLALMYG
jgi:hypothetical protein